VLQKRDKATSQGSTAAGGSRWSARMKMFTVFSLKLTEQLFRIVREMEIPTPKVHSTMFDDIDKDLTGTNKLSMADACKTASEPMS